ncbi:hypothetical protein BVC80_9045g12 [Macleaya cordata]|uniref:Nuclear pore complex protein n=1 Tax=Macleaya cordata TaxID=56857 RepID=A0A200R337_MACCD|nr:hypothetical protein BVC80_9045g12 [Macleaya cordata]
MAPAAAAGSYEGGAGGKFRKKPFRINATPYQRPPTAIRNPHDGGRNGWISKIVDPASRIISKSAQMLFSSVFRKSLPAPPPPVTEANHDPREQFREADPIIPSSGAHGRVGNVGDHPNSSSRVDGINELEQILRQKTFTRQVFIDRLTELLHSRTVDVSPDDGKKTSGPSTSQRETVQDNPELAHMVVQENGMESQQLNGGISAPTVSSSALEQDLASPAELAKAYMGNRPSKVSPSTLGLRSQALREDVSLLMNVPFTPKSPSMSLVPRSAVRFAGVSENGYLTPRPRGRSAIYSMARTPYSRVHNTGTLKIDVNATPSTSSQWPRESNTLSGGKQASKRRISVLDNDIGSVGPIRRIRQKTNMMMSPSKNMILPAPGSSLSNHGTVHGSYAAHGSASSTQKHLLDVSKHNTSNLKQSENGHSSISTTSFASVPSQSTEMAQKILQQLDKLVPSPKQKSSELKLAVAREKSPSKLTLSMLKGQALRSVEDVDSSKVLINAQNPGTFDGLGGSSVSGSRDSTPRKKDKVDENGPTKIIAFGDKLAPKENGVQTTQSTKDTVPSDKASDSAISNFAVRAPQKRAFQMSAHEDFLELDDDSYCGKVASTPLNTEKEKFGPAVVESMTVVTETVTVGNPFISSTEARPGSFILNGADTGASDGPAASKKTPAPQPLSSVERAEPKEHIASAFSFASKNFDKASQLESSGIVFGARPDSKPETSNSTAAVVAAATETASKVAELDKNDKDKTQKAGDSFKRPENAFFSPVSTSTAPSSFGASTNSSLNNGLFASTTSMFSVPATPPASDTSKGLITATATVTATATTTTTTITPSPTPTVATTTSDTSSIANTNSSQSTTSATPSFSAAPAFQFGSSTSAAVVSSNSASVPLATTSIESTDSERKTKQASPFGSLISVGASSSSFTSTGNGGIFGFSASAPSSTTNSFTNNNQPQSSNPFGSASGSLFGAQVVPAETGTGIAPFTQSTPSQFGSSAPSPVFGLSGSSALSSGSSPFGSSASGANLFSSSSGFGQSSSTSFAMPSGSFSSGSGTSIFSSSSQSASTSIFASGFGSASSPGTFQFGASNPAAGSASSPATGFSFGSSTATSAAGSAPITFGSSLASSSGSPFSFTSAPATTSSASVSPAGPVFGTTNSVMAFGSMSPSNDQMNMEDSMAEDTIQASAPVVSVFGQPANSPSPFTFGSPAPSGGTPMFQFGGQQNQVTPQNPSPFQAGNLEFAGAGSFSLGSTGGGDKSGRKMFKAKRPQSRKRMNVLLALRCCNFGFVSLSVEHLKTTSWLVGWLVLVGFSDQVAGHAFMYYLFLCNIELLESRQCSQRSKDALILGSSDFAFGIRRTKPQNVTWLDITTAGVKDKDVQRLRKDTVSGVRHLDRCARHGGARVQMSGRMSDEYRPGLSVTRQDASGLFSVTVAGITTLPVTVAGITTLPVAVVGSATLPVAVV